MDQDGMEDLKTILEHEQYFFDNDERINHINQNLGSKSKEFRYYILLVFVAYLEIILFPFPRFFCFRPEKTDQGEKKKALKPTFGISTLFVLNTELSTLTLKF